MSVAGEEALKCAVVAVDRLRALCLALPEVVERLSHGEPDPRA
jgi:hypothetical protein